MGTFQDLGFCWPVRLPACFWLSLPLSLSLSLSLCRSLPVCTHMHTYAIMHAYTCMYKFIYIYMYAHVLYHTLNVDRYSISMCINPIGYYRPLLFETANLFNQGKQECPNLRYMHWAIQPSQELESITHCTRLHIALLLSCFSSPGHGSQ